MLFLASQNDNAARVGRLQRAHGFDYLLYV